MTFHLDPNRRVRGTGTFTAELTPIGADAPLTYTLTVIMRDGLPVYTLTLDEDGTVVSQLSRFFLVHDGKTGWYSDTGDAYGSSADRAYAAWLHEQQRRMTHNEVVTDTDWRNTGLPAAIGGRP